MGAGPLCGMLIDILDTDTSREDSSMLMSARGIVFSARAILFGLLGRGIEYLR